MVLWWMMVLLLSVYGCAQAVRRLCLWLTRCPHCVACCRIAVPQNGAELAPLVRCLQSQAVWDEPIGYTLVVLPAEMDRTDEEMQCIFENAPRVIPITYDELTAMVRQMAQKG